MHGGKLDLVASGTGRMRRMIVSCVLAATLAVPALSATTFAEQPSMGTIVAISEEHTPNIPDDDDGSTEEKEDLVAFNEDVPEGVDSTEDGIALKGSAPKDGRSRS